MGHSTVTELSKFSINPDAFIFAVKQAFEARLKANGDFNSHLRYEPFLTNTWTAPKNPEFNSFKSLLAEIINHHFQILPNFHRNENVNIENIAWFSHSVATLFADLNFLIMQFTGASLPEFSGNTLPRAVSSKNIIVALQKHSEYLAQAEKEAAFSLFPLLNENLETVDHLYTQEIWSLIGSFAKKTFGNYFPLLQSYILWKYTTKETTPETVDWNVRPPCGAIYEQQFKELFEKEREERFAKRQEKQKARQDKGGFNDRKNAAYSAQTSDTKPHFKPKTAHENTVTRTQQATTTKHSNEGPSKEYKEQKNFQERLPKETKVAQFTLGFKPKEQQQDPKQQQNLEDALTEAKLAIQKMLKNKNLSEFSLAPQNSFIRRQQHSLITESGFETESLGEAKDRHVCIKRKQ